MKDLFCCWFCGRRGQRGFKIWEGKPICQSALACLKRARVGGYR